MGEIDGDGGAGGIRGGDETAGTDDCGEAECAADGGVPAKGVGSRAEVGSTTEGGRGQRDVAAVSGGRTDCGAAGERVNGAGVLSSDADAGGRSFAGERRSISGGAADAGGEQGDALADE